MKKALYTLLTGLALILPVCFLAACQDLTGPQGEAGEKGRDAALAPDPGEALAAALAAKTGGGEEPWLVKVSGLDVSDSYTARQIFHGVAAGIPQGDIDLDLSDCSGAFIGYNAGVSRGDKARFVGLTLPDSLVEIKDGEPNGVYAFGAFTDFSGLKKIRAAGLLRAGDYAFSGCMLLESLDLPQVIAIGDGAFSGGSTGNTVLTRVALPRVESIGARAFSRCIAIAELDLPEVISIGTSAFAGDTGVFNDALETVYLPKAEFIDIGAFRYCRKIKDIDLPGAQEILGYAFGDNDALERVELPEAGIVNGAFANCTALVEARLPAAGIIGNATFQGCTELTTVYAPEATSVGQYAFSGCTSLETLNLPSVRTLEGYAFQGCVKLAALTIPEVTTVYRLAFSGCTALESLELTKVGNFELAPFENCTGLSALKLGSDVPDKSPSASNANGIFAGTGSGAGADTTLTIQVPAASQSDYAAAGWVDAAAGADAAAWGTNHKQIVMAVYE